MRFLLVVVSFIFSFIFFLLYISSDLTNVVWNIDIMNISINTFSLKKFFYSICFFVIWIFFFFFFSDFTQKSLEKMKTREFIWRFIFVLYLCFIYFYIDMLYYNIELAIIVLLFIISSFIFNFLLFLKKYRKILKYIWLFSIYLSSIWSVYYLYYGFNILVFVILIYSSVFNFLFHKKHTNYISLSFSILSILSVMYFLYFFLFEFYVEYIYIYMQQLRNYE